MSRPNKVVDEDSNELKKEEEESQLIMEVNAAGTETTNQLLLYQQADIPLSPEAQKKMWPDKHPKTEEFVIPYDIDSSLRKEKYYNVNQAIY